MPCYHCGARQVDPVRGESPWKRGVRGDRQVLVCPACQASHDWTADLDRCARCSGARLVRRLGEVECRDCGSVGAVRRPGAGPVARELAAAEGAAGERAAGEGAGDEVTGDEVTSRAGLAEEVALALARVLGRSGRTADVG